MKMASFLIGLTLFCVSICYGTINVQIKTPGYIVFASDGRIMLKRDSSVTNIVVSDTREKIYRFSDNIMIQMAGMSNPCNKDLRTTFEDFKWKYEIEDTTSIFIDSLILLYREYCEKNKSQECDYGNHTLYFAGPDINGNLQLRKYSPQSDVLDTIEQYDIYYSGVTTYCNRLFDGIDSVLKLILLEKLSEDTTKLAQIVKGVVNSFKAWECQKTQLLSINDAVNIAYHLVKITILMDDLFSGRMTTAFDKCTPKTGGQITICVVTRDGVQWVLKPKIFDGEVELPQIENE